MCSFMSSLFVLFAIGRNADREDLKWGKWAGTGECHNTTSPAIPCQCEDWGVCFMLFLFLSIFRKIQFTLEECVWWLIPFWTEMTVRAVRIVVEWPKVGWISHLWLWIYAGLGEIREAKELGYTNPILKKSDFTRWDKDSVWEVRYCWVGCWGWRNRRDHADSRYVETADTKTVEPRKLTFPKLSETQSI